MRGFVLAAGFGTRLQPITKYTPKALVGVCGKPLLERALVFLRKQGITEIGVNTHYMPDRLEAFREKSTVPFALFHEKDLIRGTGGGLFFAQDFLSGDELFFVTNVDILYQFDFLTLVPRFLATDWVCALLAVPAQGGGTLYYHTATGRYCGVPAEGGCADGCAGADFIGAAIYRRNFLDLLTVDDFSIVPVWRRVARQGYGVGVFMLENCVWRDVGTPQALADAHFDVLEGKASYDVPRHLEIDRTGKRCYCRNLGEAERSCICPLAWVEASSVPHDTHIVRSVVYDGAAIKPRSAVEDLIMTPFCEVKLER